MVTFDNLVVVAGKICALVLSGWVHLILDYVLDIADCFEIGSGSIKTRGKPNYYNAKVLLLF